MKYLLRGRSLVLDRNCEVYDLLEPWADVYFYDLRHHEPCDNSIYVIGSSQVYYNQERVRSLFTEHNCLPIMCNPAEGSYTLTWHLHAGKIDNHVFNRELLLIGGGDMEPAYPNLRFDGYIRRAVQCPENANVMERIHDIQAKTHKPYKFLFLNGRARRHRHYLLARLEQLGWLDQSLWTCLEGELEETGTLTLEKDGIDVLAQPRAVHLLPPEYEIPRFQDRVDAINPDSDDFVKYRLFNGVWADIFIHPPPYIDTYFSLVTETVFSYPYSFRTEKIWKPVMIGHPWICASNRGFYRDMRDLGFRTFNKLIDESFDFIDSEQDRIERIAQVVDDLCRQDLPSFLAASREICEYNQQHLLEMSRTTQEEFPSRFFKFVYQHLD